MERAKRLMMLLSSLAVLLLMAVVTLTDYSIAGHLPDPEPLPAEKLKDDSDSSLTPHERKKRQVSRQNYMNFLQMRQDPNYDPRAEEGWWMLYPFGKIALDEELMGDAGRETQANLGFDFPFYGFRFNYTFVYPDGMIAFSRPSFMTPPFTFPNPLWPNERDSSFIGAFRADAMFQYIGNVKISNTWFRSVHRRNRDDEAWNRRQRGQVSNPYLSQGTMNNPFGGPFNSGRQLPNQQQPQSVNPFPTGGRKKRQLPGRYDQPGVVIDPYLLDNITRDIQDAYNGAQGFKAEHAFVVTWERMAYGGAPKAVDVSQFDYVRDWQNTYQLVIASDRIVSFCLFNYARLNWTTSMEAGGLNGFGGKQAAVVGFNGGNGTGWTPLPYSGHGRVWRLSYYSSGLIPGRWVYRVDEKIHIGGCSNESNGFMLTSPPFGTMVGGVVVNVTGPCLRENDVVIVNFENWQTNCQKLNRMKAKCIMPRFHKTGLVPIQMSRDGGNSFPYIGWFYVSPQRAPPGVTLKNDVFKKVNTWDSPWAEELELTWSAKNLTGDPTRGMVDIKLIGYYEDADRSHFVEVDTLAQSIQNSGRYVFQPKTMQRNLRVQEAWQKFHFGFIQVGLSETANVGTSIGELNGVFWSRITPFSWYYLPWWQSEYGENWALDMCIEWFEYDGRRRNFIMDLTQSHQCPCKLEQALLDLGRFMPYFHCDRDGDSSCPFNKGATHCVQSVAASWTGASQGCCYDPQGYLMFSDDWERTGDYTRFFNPGTPFRAHPFGSWPYKRPPRIPGMSNFQLDLMPYRMCCNYADHCEFYYWRRQTNGCQDYRPPVAGYIYGEPHVITFDGTRYTFPGKGYYVLVQSDDPEHTLMIQVRLEQPDRTLWKADVNATVVTGVVIKENNSDTVQIFARKSFRRWRYKTDIYVNGISRFFDKPHWKYQQFNGLNIRNPQRNMNQSEMIVMLDSGAGVRVSESFGMLDIMVFLTPNFNRTCNPNMGGGGGADSYDPVTGRRCYVTKGLLGTFDSDPQNDLMTPEGQVIQSSRNTFSRGQTEMIYSQFAKRWEVTGADEKIGPVLFQDRHKPIYNPPQFAKLEYWPEYMPEVVPLNATLIFNMEQVRTTCVNNPQCTYDYLMTGRVEVALTTLSYHNRFVRMNRRGSRQLISCGPLLKQEGIIKTPVAQNYLDGDVVRFSCKPDFYIHGDQERRCINGTWSPGWWAWCRDRNLEYGLKWMTAILTTLGIIMIFVLIFCLCWRRRVAMNQHVNGYRRGEPVKAKQPPPKFVGEPPPPFNGHQISKPTYNDGDYDREPIRFGGGIPVNSSGGGMPPPPVARNDFDFEPKRVGLATNGAGGPMTTYA